MPVNESFRNQVLDELSGLYARDLITIEDFERRVTSVNAASTDAELDAVRRGLPASRAQASSASYASTGYDLSAPERQDAVAIFSSSEMRGQFAAPRKLDAVAIFGGTTIDLRQAIIPAGGMEIEATAIFGGCTIILPEGVNFEASGVGIFGGFNKPRQTMGLSGPTIRITGAAVFGGVDIRMPGVPSRY